MKTKFIIGFSLLIGIWIIGIIIGCLGYILIITPIVLILMIIIASGLMLLIHYEGKKINSK